MESWFDVLLVVRYHVVLFDVSLQEDDVDLGVFHAAYQDGNKPVANG